MSDLDFDTELFGLWPKAPVYDGFRSSEADAELEQVARQVILDIKAQAISPLDDLQDMLNGMTRELREQMQQFQRLRRVADETIEAAGEEIDRKQVQADAKASIEAMSVIVRTLEKVDSLQRTIAHDRQAQADAAFDEEGYQAYVAQIDAKIELRARQLADERERDRTVETGSVGSDCTNAAGADAPPTHSTGPPHPAQGEG